MGAPPGTFTFLEFFAGGGMARAGLGPGWRCLFANDVDPKKAQTYRRNWGGSELRLADVRALTLADLPPGADLAWASFPCQDLSLAGPGAGLSGGRSAMFWPFWELIRRSIDRDGGPKLVVLENVRGLLTSRRGEDFTAICACLHAAGFAFGALVIDAKRFVPQSRPRVFLVAADLACPSPACAVAAAPGEAWHPSGLRRAVDRLSPELRQAWRWWALPEPEPSPVSLAELVEAAPADVDWLEADEVERLLAMMTPAHRERVRRAAEQRGRRVGCVYRRTRPGPSGAGVQRAEVRFDGLAGCLRTPSGGSSRQSLLFAGAGRIAVRLMSAREAARLMGLPDSYRLPENYNESYRLAGDGVVVPAVRHLAARLLEPLAASIRRGREPCSTEPRKLESELCGGMAPERG